MWPDCRRSTSPSPYVNKLADIDMDVVSEPIRADLDCLGKTWPVQRS